MSAMSPFEEGCLRMCRSEDDEDHDWLPEVSNLNFNAGTFGAVSRLALSITSVPLMDSLPLSEHTEDS
jgi:hypothetical protein